MMRKALAACMAAVMAASLAAQAQEQQAPAAPGGLEDLVIDVTKLADGWRASQLMGAPVVNEAGEAVGEIVDAVINQDDQITYAVIGVGGFLGIGQKNVAVPVERLQLQDDQVVLSGATRETLERLPGFEFGN